MKIEKKYAGKWIAIKNSKIIDSGKTLNALTKKVAERKDQKKLHFTLVPNGLIAG